MRLDKLRVRCPTLLGAIDFWHPTVGDSRCGPNERKLDEASHQPPTRPSGGFPRRNSGSNCWSPTCNLDAVCGNCPLVLEQLCLSCNRRAKKMPPLRRVLRPSLRASVSPLRLHLQDRKRRALPALQALAEEGRRARSRTTGSSGRQRRGSPCWPSSPSTTQRSLIETRGLPRSAGSSAGPSRR